MKAVKILFVFIFILNFGSCQNEDQFELNTSLIGNWEWIETSGGIAGTTESPDSTGDTRSLEITSETFKWYKNGSLLNERKYEIKLGESTTKTGKTKLVVYENEEQQTFEIEGGKLILYDECCDRFQYEYIRKN